MERSFERDIIPMARTNGLALAPWNVLAGGKLRSDAEEARREASGEKGRSVMSPSWKRNEVEKKVSGVLQKIAVEVGLDGDNVGAVAIAYLLQKTPYVFPIIGGRKVEHLLANVEALRVSLSEEQIKEIESVVPFDPGFPSNFIVCDTLYFTSFWLRRGTDYTLFYFLGDCREMELQYYPRSSTPELRTELHLLRLSDQPRQLKCRVHWYWTMNSHLESKSEVNLLWNFSFPLS